MWEEQMPLKELMYFRLNSVFQEVDRSCEACIPFLP